MVVRTGTDDSSGRTSWLPGQWSLVVKCLLPNHWAGVSMWQVKEMYAERSSEERARVDTKQAHDRFHKGKVN